MPLETKDLGISGLVSEAWFVKLFEPKLVINGLAFLFGKYAFGELFRLKVIILKHAPGHTPKKSRRKSIILSINHFWKLVDPR